MATTHSMGVPTQVVANAGILEREACSPSLHMVHFAAVAAGAGHEACSAWHGKGRRIRNLT
jgi:hypothetical protein